MAQFAIYSVFHWWIESQILAELSHVRSARSGAPLVMKIQLSIHPRSFGSEKIVHSSIRKSTPLCKLEWNFAFQAPCSFQGEITWPSGLNEFFFPLNLISTLTWTTGKELERELNNNGDQLRWKKSIKVLQQRFENEKCQRGYQKNRNTSISSIKRVNRKVKVFLVPQNNGKEMYQKVCCTCKIVVLLILLGSL